MYEYNIIYMLLASDYKDKCITHQAGAPLQRSLEHSSGNILWPLLKNIFTVKPSKSVACVEIKACKNSSSVSMLLSKLIKKKDTIKNTSEDLNNELQVLMIYWKQLLLL